MTSEIFEVMRGYKNHIKCNLTLPELKIMYESFRESEDEKIALNKLGLELIEQKEALGKAILPTCCTYPPCGYRIRKVLLDEIIESVRNISFIYYPVYDRLYGIRKEYRELLLKDPNEAFIHLFNVCILQGSDKDSEIIKNTFKPFLSLSVSRSQLEGQVKKGVEKIQPIFEIKKTLCYRKKDRFNKWISDLIMSLFDYCQTCPKKNVALRMQRLSPKDAFIELDRKLKGAGQKVALGQNS